MGENAKAVTSTIRLLSTTTLLSFLLGYFVYGGLEGGLGMALLSLLLGILMIISLIPILGNITYFWVGTKILDWVLTLTGLGRTWLTTAIYWYEGVCGIIVSLLVMSTLVLAIATKN